MNSSILTNKTILIVDDFQINTELLSMFAADAGATPLTASNGMECIEIVKSRHVDMILMDSEMPVMNGIEATKAIRTMPQSKDVIIIGISCYDDEEATNECLQAGMNLVTAKLSLSEQKLIDLARQFLVDSNDPSRQYSPMISDHVEAGFESTDNNGKQQILDYDKALKEFENDNKLLVSLIIDFSKIVRSQIITMQKAITISDYVTIRKESHGIKGGAANLCALPLADAAKALETACKKATDKDAISSLLDDFVRTYESFERFVREDILNASGKLL